MKNLKRKLFWGAILILAIIIAYELGIRILVKRGKMLYHKSHSGAIVDKEERLSVKKKALSYFQIAYKVQPWNQEIKLNLAEVYGGLAFYIASRKLESRYDEALLYATTAFLISDSLSENERSSFHLGGMNPHLFAIATIYHLQGQFERETETYQWMIRENPNSPGALHKLGQIYILQGQLKDSRWHLNKAVTLTPHDHKYHWRIQRDIAYLDYLENDIEVAASRIEKVLQNLSNDTTLTFYIYGLILKERKQYEDAEQFFLMSIENKTEEIERWHQYIEFDPERHLREIRTH